MHLEPCAEDNLAALKTDWNRLLRASYANTVFSTWEWQTCWWRNLADGDLRLSTVRAADGALAAIFPCYRRVSSAGERLMRLVGCVEVADYLDLIVASGQEGPALALFVNSLAADTGWDTLELCNIREGSPTLTFLPPMARQAGFRAEVMQADVCPVIELPATFDDYLLALDKKQRHEIRRKLRRAQTEANLEWYVAGEGHDLAEEVDVFLDLHSRSSRDKGEFMTPKMQAFFHDLARVMQEAGWLQLIQLKLDGRREASLLSFDYDETIMLYNSGYDPAGHPSLSPGIVLVAIGIQHAIQLRRNAFDFLRGDEEYKYRFGARDKDVFRILIRRGL